MTNDLSNRRHKPEPQTAERAALEALVEKVIGAAYEVGNVLGAGFLEKIYERALTEELGLRGVPVKAQAPFPVAYKGKHIGTYAADLVVDNEGHSPGARRAGTADPRRELPVYFRVVAVRVL